MERPQVARPEPVGAEPVWPESVWLELVWPELDWRPRAAVRGETLGPALSRAKTRPRREKTKANPPEKYA
jgi:hypothetical protein